MTFLFIGAGFDVNDDVYNDRVEYDDELQARLYFNDELDDQRYIYQILLEVQPDGSWTIVDQICTDGMITDWYVSDTDGIISVSNSNL